MDIMTGLLPAGGRSASADRILVYNLSLVIRNKCRGGAGCSVSSTSSNWGLSAPRLGPVLAKQIIRLKRVHSLHANTPTLTETMEKNNICTVL